MKDNVDVEDVIKDEALKNMDVVAHARIGRQHCGSKEVCMLQRSQVR